MKRMKHIISTLALVLGMMQIGQAQVNTRAIKVQPIYGFSYEKIIKGDNTSLDFNVLHNSYRSSFVNFEEGFELEDRAKMSFTGVMPSVRFYTSKKKDGMRGFYLAPYAALGMGKIQGEVKRDDMFESESVTYNGAVMEVGGNLGWQWQIGSGLVLGIQGGMGWQRNTFGSQTIEVDGQSESITLSGNERINVPKLQFSIGYAF